MIFRVSLIVLALGFAAPAQAQRPIEVSSLRNVDPLEAGAPSTGLTRNLWRGADAAIAKAALKGALTPVNSPALQRLRNAALLSGGVPPEGGRDDAELATLRFEALFNAGLVYEAAELMRRLPGAAVSPEFARLKADGDLYAGETDEACKTADSVVEGRDEPYWIKLRAFCFALNGQPAAAELTAELARTQGDEDEPFAELLARLTGASASEDEIMAGNALHLALAERTGAALSAQTLTEDGWGVTGAIARSGGASPDVRLAAAHRLALMGSLEADRLATAYEAYARGLTEGTAVAPAAMYEVALEEEGPSRAAILHAVVRETPDPALAAGAIARAISDAETPADLLLVSRLYVREIDFLPRTAVDAEKAELFAFAAVAAGDTSVARAWRAVLPEEGHGGLDLLILASAGAFNGADAIALTKAQLDKGDLAPALFFAAMGAPLTADMRLALRKVKDGADEATDLMRLPEGELAALGAAAAARSEAETALNAAAIVGSAQLETVAAADLAVILAALRTAGLEPFARELLLDVLIARGGAQ